MKPTGTEIIDQFIRDGLGYVREAGTHRRMCADKQAHYILRLALGCHREAAQRIAARERRLNRRAGR